MKKTIEDFAKLVNSLWCEDRHKYGSMQFPAREAMEQMKIEGVENAQELYDEFYKRNRSTFHYAGD
jgi:hypothetical protein